MLLFMPLQHFSYELGNKIFIWRLIKCKYGWKYQNHKGYICWMKKFMKKVVVQAGVNLIIYWDQELGVIGFSNEDSELGSNEKCQANQK